MHVGVLSDTVCMLSVCSQVVTGVVHSFAAGRDSSGLTLAYIDKDTAFCDQVRVGLSRWHLPYCHAEHGLSHAWHIALVNVPTHT